MEIIRELKDRQINVFFEGLGINTIEENGQLLIKILASIAEEESRNLSKNVKWSVDRRFQNGELIISTIYGYRLVDGENPKDKKRLAIHPDEALIVRRMFREYLDGYTAAQISRRLNGNGVPTYYEKEWRAASVMRILRNEKYKGDALLQKSFMANFLAKKRKINGGEVQSYNVSDSHPPIIDRDTYDMVQTEIRRRDGDAEGNASSYAKNYPFSRMIRCGCGSLWRRWKYNGYAVWVCNKHQRMRVGEDGYCAVTPVKEVKIEDAWVRAINGLIGDRDAFIAELTNAAAEVITEKTQAEYDVKTGALDELRGQIIEVTRRDNTPESRAALTTLMASIDALTAETAELSDLIAKKKLASQRLDDIQAALSGELLNAFDPDLFRRLTAGMEIQVTEDVFELEIALSCGVMVRERI